MSVCAYIDQIYAHIEADLRCVILVMVRWAFLSLAEVVSGAQGT